MSKNLPVISDGKVVFEYNILLFCVSEEKRCLSLKCLVIQSVPVFRCNQKVRTHLSSK